MRNPSRGKAYIFNHEVFDPQLQLSTREGTNRDRDALENTLNKLHFVVQSFNNLKKAEIMRKLIERKSIKFFLFQLFNNVHLNSVSNEDHSDRDCVVVAVLSHGEDEGTIYAYDQTYSVDEFGVFFSSDNCNSLAGKPKLFFFQVCHHLESHYQVV